MSEDIRKILAENISRLSAERRWTQEKTAEKAHMSLTSVQRLLAMERFPRPESLMSLAEAFGVETWELLQPLKKTDESVTGKKSREEEKELSVTAGSKGRSCATANDHDRDARGEPKSGMQAPAEFEPIHTSSTSEIASEVITALRSEFGLGGPAVESSGGPTLADEALAVLDAYRKAEPDTRQKVLSLLSLSQNESQESVLAEAETFLRREGSAKPKSNK